MTQLVGEPLQVFGLVVGLVQDHVVHGGCHSADTRLLGDQVEVVPVGELAAGVVRRD